VDIACDWLSFFNHSCGPFEDDHEALKLPLHARWWAGEESGESATAWEGACGGTGLGWS